MTSSWSSPRFCDIQTKEELISTPSSRTAGRRQTTETKASFKTSEFIVFVLMAIGLFIGAATVDARGEGGFTPTEMWRFLTYLAIGYMISRGLSKAGSREPYWSDGSNSDRH